MAGSSDRASSLAYSGVGGRRISGESFAGECWAALRSSPDLMLSSTSWAYCEKPSRLSLDFLLPILSWDGTLGNEDDDGDCLVVRPNEFASGPFKMGESPAAPLTEGPGFDTECPLYMELLTC